MTNEEAAQHNQAQGLAHSQGQGLDGQSNGQTYVAPLAPKLTPPVSFRMVGDMAPLFAAKAAARLSFRPIIKNRTVKVQPQNSAAYTFEYATLDSVRESCDEALANQGLDIFHACVDAEDARELHTFLTHGSGAFLECVIVLPSNKTLKDGTRIPLTIQETGSAMTYWERYSYVALAGVASEHDDDGNAADGNKVEAMQPRDRSRPATPPKPPTRPQAAPKPDEAPRAQPVTESAPQPKSEPPPAPTELLATADKMAELKALFVALQFKGTPAKEFVSLVAGKDYGKITNTDVDALVSVLEKAKDCQWDCDRLMLLVRETPDPETVIRTIQEESEALGAG